MANQSRLVANLPPSPRLRRTSREAVRQDVLEIAPHELKGFEAHLFSDLGTGGFVFEEHFRVGELYDPTGRDGDAEDVLRDIFQRLTGT